MIFMTIDEIENLFRKHVDYIISTYQFDKYSIEARYPNIELIQLISHIENLFMKNLQGKDGSQNIRDLNDAISTNGLLKHYGFRQKFTPYVEIADFINAHSSSEKAVDSLTNEVYWRGFLLLTLDYKTLSQKEYLNLDNHSREKNEGKAINYWRKKGYTCKVENGNIIVPEKNIIQISKKIESSIQKIGGEKFITYLLSTIPFNSTYNRYLFSRTRSLNSGDIIELDVPYRYLFSLAVKHVKPNEDIHLLQSDIFNINKTIENSKHFIALLQLQSYNAFETIFTSIEQLIPLVIKSVAYDTIFTLKQFKPTYLIKMIKGLLKNFYSEVLNLDSPLAINFEELISLIEFFLQENVQPTNFRKFTIEQLEKEFPSLTKKQLISTLELFTHNKHINANYLNPFSHEEFTDYPLLKIGNLYCIIDSRLCGFSFFTRLCKILKETINNFEGRLGTQLELFIYNLLNEKNITYHNGFYNIQDECDTIIETSDSIFFMEIKKKQLQKRSLLQDDVELFYDISQSILHSQSQLGKHQLFLLKKGSLELYEKRGKRNSSNKLLKSIYLNDRNIERINITLDDYGILNDKQLLMQLLKMFTFSKIKAIDEKKDSKLSDARKYSLKLQEQFNELQNINYALSDDVNHLYTNTSFMSLQLLMTRLENVNGNNEFGKDYRITRNIIQTISEPFFEYYNMLQLKRYPG